MNTQDLLLCNLWVREMAFGLLGTMLVYLVPAFAGISNLKIKNKLVTNGILIYCAIVTALAWQVGSDFNRYLGIISNATVLELTLIEPITETIYFLTNIIGEPRVFWVMLGLITYGSLYFLIQGLEESEKDGTIILFFLLFGIIGIALRQMSSVTVSLLAIQSYYNKQYRKAAFFLLLAWSIHKIAFMALFVPIVGFLLKNLNKHTLVLVPPVFIILITIFQDIILFFLDPIPLLGKYWLALMTYEEGLYLSTLGIVVSIGYGIVYFFSSDFMRNNLSARNYEFYLVGIFGFGGIFGFSSIHAGRLMVVFAATGIPALTHFFKTYELPIATGLPASPRIIKKRNIPGILAVVFSVIFITVLLFEHNYIPYNISKDITWESEDDLDYKLGFYDEEYFIYIPQHYYPQNDFVESTLIPVSLVLVIVTAAGFVILNFRKD